MEHQSENLNEAEAERTFQAIFEVIKRYFKHNSTAKKNHRQFEKSSEEKAAYSDMVTIIKILCILSGLTQTYTQAEEGRASFKSFLISIAVLFGISLALPLITRDLLEVML